MKSKLVPISKKNQQKKDRKWIFGAHSLAIEPVYSLKRWPFVFERTNQHLPKLREQPNYQQTNETT